MKSGFLKFILILIITVLFATGGTVIYFIYDESLATETVSETTAETAPEAFYIAAPDGTEITDTYSFMMSPWHVYGFTVKGDITVQVVPNTGEESNNFEFTHNGKRKQFFAENNLLNAFDIVREGNTLKVSLKEGCTSLKSVLEKIYQGETIEMPAEFARTEKIMFVLKIREQGSIVFRTVYFGINKAVISVSVSPVKIIF